jgi:hypothetical protein
MAKLSKRAKLASEKVDSERQYPLAGKTSITIYRNNYWNR